MSYNSYKGEYLIDSHQHVWKTSEREYSWITDDVKQYFQKDFEQSQINEAIKEIGITGTVYIQAADTYDDTFAMFESAQENPGICGIVGWVPFERPKEARVALDIFQSGEAQKKLFKGVRNLTHDYSNPKYESDDAWILRPKVLETIEDVAKRGLSLDYVAIKPNHTRNVAVLAQRFPDLHIIVDHFAKPDIKNREWEGWAEVMAEIAEYPNVFTKFSGLNVLSDWESWSISDWQPYLAECMKLFGSHRIMMGSDWPFCTMANDFKTVWNAQIAAISQFSAQDQENLAYETAKRAYNL
jgi:L-fuconolactonase